MKWFFIIWTSIGMITYLVAMGYDVVKGSSIRVGDLISGFFICLIGGPLVPLFEYWDDITFELRPYWNRVLNVMDYKIPTRWNKTKSGTLGVTHGQNEEDYY